MSQKLRNYRGSLTYVNLVPARLAILARHFSHVNDLCRRTPSKIANDPFYFPLILCVINKFGANQHCGGSWALMRSPASQFAIFPPTLRAAEYEN